MAKFNPGGPTIPRPECGNFFFPGPRSGVSYIRDLGVDYSYALPIPRLP